MLEMVKMLNLALRFLLELCALAAVGYWGFKTGSNVFLRYCLGIGAPLLIAVVWGALGSPNAPISLPPLPHLLLEIVIFGLPALALYAVGKPFWALVYGFVAIINRILMFTWGQ
ncbi:YrdB family protein [Brevibacillus sp. SYSU BS000544]|uniref:YrdB family protein n=1 Tax=Brevibacillus sp. SYSU BS000544 TaxID=3416443 RepID=UPI003CE59325